MALIKEPKHVDFYVIDKPWTDAELKELSAFIKQRKGERKKRGLKRINSGKKKVALSSS